MNLDAALQTFFVESRELLASMEDALLSTGREPGDDDAMNATFRAIHPSRDPPACSGPDGIVRYCPRGRNPLTGFDRQVPCERYADRADARKCGDHIGQLVGVAAGDRSVDSTMLATRSDLLARLRRFTPSSVPDLVAPEVADETSITA